jgi:uncharacterized tellurite resistance protein B-like protein
MADQKSLGAEFLYNTHFGFATAPSKTNPADAVSVAKLLFSAVNGDGKITPEERAWIKGYWAAKAYSQELIDGLDAMKPLPAAEVAPLLREGTLPFSGLAIIYDAIRAASADHDFAPGERDVIMHFAKVLEIKPEIVAQLEQIVHDEEELKKRRVALLFPKGHPNLHPKYKP